MNKTVFVSHNSANKTEAREIGLFLAAEDINVWFDEWKIPYGSSIPKHVNNGLSSCTHFLLIWSKAASKSRWVERELNSVLHKALSDKKPNIIIVPVCLDETPLPMIVADKLSITYSKGDEADRYAIIKAITGNAPSKNFIEAIVKKYNEVIYNKNDDVLGLSACPQCGKDTLDKNSFLDEYQDEMFYIATCKNCNWSDWTQ